MSECFYCYFVAFAFAVFVVACFVTAFFVVAFFLSALGVTPKIHALNGAKLTSI